MIRSLRLQMIVFSCGWAACMQAAELETSKASTGVNAFEVLWSAIKTSKEGLWASFQVLFCITLVLATIYYLSEMRAKPGGNYMKSLLWAFTRYIDDPGRLSDSRPRTITGRVVATIIGVLGILIVAVPAGILGSGFTEAIDNNKRMERLVANQEKLRRFFERKLDRPTGYQAVSFFRSFADIQARTGMTEGEIIETVENTPDFRIINTALTIPVEQKPVDRLAVEHFPLNTSYGVCIDRGSRVTIVATSNLVDPTVGIFSFYLAMIGNFNYISRELGDRVSYKTLMNKKPDEHYSSDEEAYFKDLERLMKRSGSWSFDFMPASGSSENAYDTELHFGIGNGKGIEDFEGDDLLVKDIETYKKFYAAISQRMEERFGILSDNGRYHSTSSENIWRRVLPVPADANSVVVRVAWSAMLWNDQRLLIAKTFAECINEYILGQKDVAVPEVLKKKDIGYGGYDL